MPATERRDQTDEVRAERRREVRENRDYAAYRRAGRREDKASEMIGELVRDGQTVFYVHPTGGRYREGTRASLIQYLIRNHHA